MVKKVIRVYFLCFLLIVSAGFCAESYLVKQAVEARGDWKKGVLLGREVLMTGQNNATAEITLDVPEDGDYYIYATVFQNWRKYTPFIYIEARDAQGNKHSDYTFFEHCWYLDKDEPGRWLTHSFNASPWHLPKGRVSLIFSACGKKSVWGSQDIKMENILAVKEFILVRMPANGVCAGCCP